MSVIRKKRNNGLFSILAALAALFLLGVLVLLRLDLRDTAREPALLRLWYVDDGHFAPLLERAQSIDLLSGTGSSLQIRCFETEDELAAALDLERPEMLYCAGDAAEALSLNGSLEGISSYMSALPEDYSGLAGNEAFEAGEFFPLRLEAELLVYNAAVLGSVSSFEEVMSFMPGDFESEAVALFACDSYYFLLEALTAESGYELSPSRLENAGNEVYASAYNSLAGCAMEGMLYSGELEPLQAVLKGECLCCGVSSDLLDSLELPEGFSLCLPTSGVSFPTVAWGIAVTAEDRALAESCAPVIERLASLSAMDGMLSPFGKSEAAPAGTAEIIIKGYAPGVEAGALEFDEEISRLLSILCE